MRAQRGVTLSGFLFWSVVVVVGLLLGFKLFPVYYEHYSIQRTLDVITSDDSLRSLTKRDVESSFVRRAVIENITGLKTEDLVISRAGSGWVIDAEYAVKVPLFGNLSACMDFVVHSEAK